MIDFVLQGVSCSLCSIAFGYRSNKGKPSNKTPVYACNRMKSITDPCQHAVCFDCFDSKVKQSLDGNTERMKRT